LKLVLLFFRFVTSKDFSLHFSAFLHKKKLFNLLSTLIRGKNTKAFKDSSHTSFYKMTMGQNLTGYCAGAWGCLLNSH
jgi:hypothetical protein